jgi:uncharacterized membrane protein
MEKIFRFLAYCECLVGGKAKRGKGLPEMVIMIAIFIVLGMLRALFILLQIINSDNSLSGLFAFSIILALIWFWAFSNKSLEIYKIEFKQLSVNKDFRKDIKWKTFKVILFSFIACFFRNFQLG